MNPPGENLRGLIESGIKQIQAGQFGVAEKTLSSVLKQTPNDPGVLHLLGLSRHLSGNHAGAIAPIQQAVALVPSNDSFLNSLGQAHQALGEHNETVLGDLLGMTSAEITALSNSGIISSKPH